jgi:DNA-binding transcriptional regulator PaaX
MLMFDLEFGREAMRRGIHRWLHSSHFGFLQKSVWLHPHACQDLGDMLDKQAVPAGSVLLFQGRPAGERVTDAELVEAAWQFDEINARYRAYLDFAKTGVLRNPTPSGTRKWANAEASLWRAAVSIDPLLPSELLAKDYLGKKAWSERRKLLLKAAGLIGVMAAEEAP